jgi:ferredoxin
MNVRIDQDGCIECGVCQQVCAEVVVVESGDKSAIVNKYRQGTSHVGEVPDSLGGCVDEAVTSCPVQVISVE